jgi:hypothetical protein
VYLASPRLSQERRVQLTSSVMAFARSAKGQSLMQAWGYGELIPASERDLEPLAPYGALLKAALAAPAGSGDAALQRPPQ